MRKITQEEFDKFPVASGYKQCPTGDYSDIKKFHACCRFAANCNFGKGSSFGKGCSFAANCCFDDGFSFAEGCYFAEGCEVCGHKIKHRHVISLSGVGENKRTLYIWLTEGGVYCQAGCFFGSEYEFIEDVRVKYGENSDYERALDFLKSINEEQEL